MIFFFPIFQYFPDVKGLGIPGGSLVKNPPANTEDTSLIPGSGRFLEKEMATHSSILAWEIPQTEEPGKLLSMGLQKGQTWLNDKNNFSAEDSLLLRGVVKEIF